MRNVLLTLALALLLCLPASVITLVWTHDGRWFISGVVAFVAGLSVAWWAAETDSWG